MTNQRSIQFILGSGSARRKQLLGSAGYKFHVVVPDIDEEALSTDNITAVEYAKQLALVKAKNVALEYPTELVLGADTIADFNGRIIGKPVDAEDAERITRLLFSAPHKVITAVALIRIADNNEIVEAETTVVYPKKLTDEQITAHIKNGSWQGKAGAYAIQEAGDKFIEKIEGSITNVMGLPMELTQRLLALALSW